MFTEIPWYNWLYLIDNKWIIISTYRWNNKKLSTHITNNWYIWIHLFKDWKQIFTTVHRLMWITFLWLEPKSKLVINHKDFNKTNNCLENLEVCSQSYNVNYSLKVTPRYNTSKVYQYDLYNNLISEYNSLLEASIKTNISNKLISKCLNWKQKTTNSFIFTKTPLYTIT